MSNFVSGVESTQKDLQEMLIDNLVKNNPDLYSVGEGENKKVYQVHLIEKSSDSLSFDLINRNWGSNAKYDANVDYQRLKDQHSAKSKQKILHDILIGERVGRIVLYKKPQSVSKFEVVDGKQRIEILRSFKNGELSLKGKYAASFWAKYLQYLKSEGPDSVKINKIRKQLAYGKSIKNVVFSELPQNIQDEILSISFDVTEISSVDFTDIQNGMAIGRTHEHYSPDMARKAIIKKFGKLNTQVKQMKTIDSIYGQPNDIVIDVRDFVREPNSFLNSIGIEFGDESDTDSQRNYALVLIKSLLMYEEKDNGQYYVDWAVNPKTIESLVMDDQIDTLSQKGKNFLTFLRNVISEVFGSTYVKNGDDVMVELPNEFIGKGKTTINLILLNTIYEFYNKSLKDVNWRKKYLQSGQPTNRMFRFFDIIMKYISVASMSSKKDIDEFVTTTESPIIKYNLQDDYYDVTTKDLLDRVMFLNRNNAGMGKDFRNTLTELCVFVDNKLG